MIDLNLDIVDRLRSVPIVGTLAASIADIVFYSGETIVAVLALIVETLDLWIPFFDYLAKAAERVDWLPEQLFDNLFLAAILLIAAVYAARIARRLISERRNNDA